MPLWLLAVAITYGSTRACQHGPPQENPRHIPCEFPGKLADVTTCDIEIKPHLSRERRSSCAFTITTHNSLEANSHQQSHEAQKRIGKGLNTHTHTLVGFKSILRSIRQIKTVSFRLCSFCSWVCAIQNEQASSGLLLANRTETIGT